ncbi:PREDICTED: meiosis-specific coiled-coil domain-containing protein MEIOC isoform X1 [Lepidothrix coronata]|uniref:Meiosis-specific coiled-coil domain-containing protein MEIOC isoform X1 n=1 Tax=Lepidothrix coronata TaxID=321398 RepID=A0A6J0J5X2_9PASS|nr:PREDICTED: meiosis-specific coiled-coil domain-containing protein MEIOC isoform X1 [Lepidothrix coronata]
MEPSVAFRGGSRCWGSAEAGGRPTDVFSAGMPGSGSLYGCYKSQNEENVELPQTYSSSLSTSEYSAPVDPSLLYPPWSTCADDSKQPSAPQINLKPRIQPERNDYGSETDLYGLVSNILEEQDKPQPCFAEGSCPPTLKSVWPVNASRMDHHDLLAESRRAAAVPQQGFYSSESVPAAEKQFLASASLVSQQKADDCYCGFAIVELEEQNLYPARGERANMQSNEGVKATPAYQNYPYLKNTFLPQAGYSEAIKDSGADAYSYGREKMCPKGADAQVHPKRAETFLPQCHRYSESTDYSRYTEYSHAGKVKPNKSTSCSLQENRKVVNGTPEAPSLDAEPYAKLFQVKSGTQKKFEDTISDQHDFTFPKSVGLVSEKQFANEPSFSTDFGQKIEYGLKSFAACPGNNGMEKQQFSKADLQNPEFYKSLSLLPNAAVPSAGSSARPAWMNIQTKPAASSPFQNPSPLLKVNNQSPAFPKSSSHSNDVFQLPSSNLPLNCNLLHKYCQDNSFLSGLDLGYSAAERARAAACVEALVRGGEENLIEYLSEKKLKQPNGFCDSYLAQQFGIIDNLNKQRFQLKPQSEHCDLEGQNQADGVLQDMYQELLESQGQLHLRAGSGDSNAINPGSSLQAPGIPNCVVGDFRRNRQLGSGTFPVRSAHLLGRSVVPLVEPHTLFSQDDLKRLYPCFTDKMFSDSALSGFVSAFGFQKQVKNRSGPASELHVRLEECYEQWRALEKERKKTESALAKNFQGKKVSSTNNIPIPRLTSNPSRVDRLIVDQLREQARVVTLLGKMERLRSSPLHANISTALDKHLESIHVVQARRKDEIVNPSNRQRHGPPRCQDERVVLALAVALRALCQATRKVRTVLWCAFQMTLPKPSAGKRARDRVPQELAPTEEKRLESAAGAAPAPRGLREVGTEGAPAPCTDLLRGVYERGDASAS